MSSRTAVEKSSRSASARLLRKRSAPASNRMLTVLCVFAMSSISNLAFDFRDDVVSKAPIKPEPLEEPRSIRGCDQSLFYGPDQDAKRRHEPDPQNLAGPNGIPVVGGEDRRVSHVQCKHYGLGLSKPQPEILHEA